MTELQHVGSKKMEEEGSLLQLSTIVEESHDAIIGWTLSGTITSWNDGAEKMLGYSAEEMIGRSALFLYPPEILDELPTLLAKVKAGEVIDDHDSVRLRKDGSRIDVALSFYPVHSAGGEIVGAVLVLRDNTERKSDEARIQRKTQLYSALSRCNRAIVSCKNENELFQQICNVAVQFGGMTMAWVGLLDEASKQVRSVASFGAGSEYVNNIQISIAADDQFGRGPTGTAIREGRPVWCQDFQHDPMTIPWRDRAKNFDWRSSASLPLHRNNTPIGGLSLYSNYLNAFDDDTQRLLMEMVGDISFALDNFARAEKQKRSEESLRQTQSIVEHSTDAIISETFDGIITSWNGGAEKIFGYSAEEIVGRSIMLLVPPEKKDEVSAIFQKIRTGEVVADHDSVRLRKDGSRINISLSNSPIKNEDGTVIGVSSVERDITARKKAEQHIVELNELRSKFIEIISHQLGTPLTAVNWNLEAMLKGNFGKLEETQRKFLEITYRSSIEIMHRIRDLLTAMDIEEGRVVFRRERASLDSITGAVMNEITKRCEFKKLSCEYIAPEKNLPEVEVDSEKIRTAIMKIVENAVMYTKEQGKIVAKLESRDGKAHFEVKDTGIGIPALDQRHIFERFFRGSNASTMQTDSFGLGLSIAKNFIEQHGGTIGFESKEGEGSTFWFEIPMNPIY